MNTFALRTATPCCRLCLGLTTTEVLRSHIKRDMMHVPYKGGGPAVAALVGGQIDEKEWAPWPRIKQAPIQVVN